MFALVVGAVRTRTAQVVTVLVLTALAAGVAAAGPWFAYAGVTRAAAADVAAAPAGQRTLSVRQIADTGGDPRGALDQFGRTVRGQLPLPVSPAVTGAVVALTVNRGAETPAMSVAYRDDFCGHVLLDGPCPKGPRDVAISQDAAQQLGVGPGDTLSLRASPTIEPITLTIVGRYSVPDPAGPYWSNPLFQARDGGLEPVFTPLATFTSRQLWEPTITWDVQVPDRLIRGDGGYDLSGVLRDADVRLGQSELRLVTTTARLLETIAGDRRTIRVGVLVSMIQIVVLAWFAIGLAGRYTGRDRRGDAALLKLRGSTRLGMLRLAWGQHLVPLVLGALIGAPLGYLLASALAGPVRPADRHSAVLLSAAAVAAVLLGGSLVLALVEAVVLRLPVADLLRDVTSGRGGWRGGLVDLLLLAVAVAAVYQARASGPDSGLALAAPALVALAVALLLARLLGRLADRGGGAAVRAGRLRLGLTAVQVSRRPGTDRVFALLVVAVAMFATAAGGWQADRINRMNRSAAELGATRVLSVQAANRTALEQAVRSADPPGREAMAVVADVVGTPGVIAVDSSRLAAVARWRPEYGPVGALPSAGADAPAPRALPAITGDHLTVRVRRDGGAAPALGLVLQNEGTGLPVKVPFGVLRAGEQTVTAAVAGCAAPPGCRILRWELTTPAEADGRTAPAPAGTAVTVRGLIQQNPPATILDRGALGDITRWRSGTSGAAMDVAAAGGVLRMAVDKNSVELPQVGFQVYAVDTVVPLPIVLAGPPPASWRFAEPALSSFGGSPVPVRVAGTAAALPVLGRAGVLVDLDAARRLTGDANPAGQFQVWLGPGARAGIVDRLTAGGLVVLGDDTVTGRAGRLGEQGPSAASRFGLVAGVVALLLAAAAVAVAAAVDRRTRLDELRALRAQGLPGRVAVATGWAGTAALVLAGLLGGIAAAAVARPLARTGVPPFTDGWDVLPPPAALGAAPLAVAGSVALAVLGLTAWLSVRPLIRRLREAGR
jgi:putative ABC transport system permease protein